MKAAELKDKSVDELKAELLALSREQFNLRMQKGAGQSPKSSVMSTVRRQIARVKTVLHQKGCIV